MTKRTLRVVAIVWIVVAVLLRIYGSKGGDASIVSGLLFLVWTAPFGPIWQFWISDLVPAAWAPLSVQVIGDIFVIVVGGAFWFFILPMLVRFLKGSARPPAAP